jgi:phage-related protein
VEAGNEIHDAYDGGSEVVDGYEQLRARALCGDVDGWRLGLGVLQQRGVAAWLRARQAATAATLPPPTPARAASAVGTGIDAALVGLLASMVLAVAARG